MRNVDYLTDHLWGQALGWTVVHSLWQAALMAILLAVLHLFWKNNARLRYQSSLVALGLTLAWSVRTFLHYLNGSAAYSALPMLPNEEIEPGINVFSPVLPTPTTTTWSELIMQEIQLYLEQHLPFIILCWLVGFSIFLLRLLGGMLYVQHLRRRYVQPMEAVYQEQLAQLAQRLQIHRPVAFLESAQIQVPMLIGHLKPAILFPAGVVTGLEPVQLEAILAHELAHLRRYDYLVNILQSFIEALYYFNPAVWWISARIRSEREHCCDDMAVLVCGDNFAYAKALVQIQQAQQQQQTVLLAMHFSGRKNHLFNRIKRVLHHPQTNTNFMEKLIASCLIIVAFLGYTLQAGTLEDVLPVEDEPFMVLEKCVRDSLPPGKVRLRVNQNGKDLEVRLQDQEIEYLKVDGEVIPPERYAEFKPMVDKALNNVPPPPPPPAPAAPNAPPAPPVPPVPNEEHEFTWSEKGNVKVEVITEEDEDGNQIIIVEREMEEPMRFRFDSNEDHIILNGEAVPGFPEGYRFKILDSMDMDIDLEFTDELEGINWMEMDSLSEKKLEGFRRKAEKMAERQERIIIRMQESDQKRMEHEVERMENEAREMERRHRIIVQPDVVEKEFFFGPKDLKSRLKEELLRDGFIEEGDSWSVDIQKSKLKINGKKQVDGLRKKYQQIYEESTGVPLTDKSRIEINGED